MAYWHNQLDDILHLRAKPNRNQNQIDNDIKKQTEIQKTIEEIKKKLKMRIDNNQRVRECRQRQQKAKDYIITHKSDIIVADEYEMNDVNMYSKPGRPRTELLAKGKGLAQCMQTIFYDLHSYLMQLNKKRN